MKINNMKINIEEQIDNLDNDIINITNETTEDYLSDLLKLKLDIIDISNERIENHCSDLSKLDELSIEKVNYKQFKYKIDKEYHFRQYQINEFIKEINSIPNDTRCLFLNSGCKYFYHFGFYDFNIFRFKKVEELCFSSLYLHSFPNFLNEEVFFNSFRLLRKIDFEENYLKKLPNLPFYLKIVNCSSNRLTSLPDLPDWLEKLNCSYNLLTSLPDLPHSLEKLICNSNRLTFLPDLPDSLIELNCENNPLIYKEYTITCVNQTNKKLKNWTYLFYSVKFKSKFITWYYKSQEKNIMQKYHHNYLIENLHEDKDLDELLNNW